MNAYVFSPYLSTLKHELKKREAYVAGCGDMDQVYAMQYFSHVERAIGHLELAREIWKIR